MAFPGDARGDRPRDEEHERLMARSYQWLRASQRRRLRELDARATAARYPWLGRTASAGPRPTEDSPER
jgi:hypothetical protein